MTGSAIVRGPATITDGRITFDNDIRLTWPEADARAGFRLDRRKTWAFFPNEEGFPELHALISYTTACLECSDDEAMYPKPKGGGCLDCGYHGVRRERCFVPFSRENWL